jgi:predicted secreted protein
MFIGSAIAVYFIFWWLTLFTVLPFAARTKTENSELVAGSDTGAPASPNIRLLLGITTIVSAGVFGIFWLIYVMNIFDLAVITDLRR